MTLDLDRKVEHLIEQEVANGHFPSAASVIDAAVQHLVDSRQRLNHSRAEIDRMLSSAIDSLDRGESIDGETFFKELEQRGSSPAPSE